MKKLRTLFLTIAVILGVSVTTMATTHTTTHASQFNNTQSKYAGVANYARRFVGTRYVWGGTTPRGFDCSGFVQYVFRNGAGKNLPRTAAQMSLVVRPINVRDAKAGDLLFWGGRGRAYHVAISLGNGNFINAVNPRVGVNVNHMGAPTFAGRLN
ncbi:C40 family peptidase [Periweissella ghanensis]|uniref:NlpC/P60 domain-containing protein n=1 Tax=Periweissella ghanensis TaxID=467997 RepID=A0ABN8BRW3_9LACO|nr:C40 family peptidase [Periweissella ghanensis]MCM0600025.1 C40 family peptidase [Periweissella ghanensis]CAH0418919.1 hypothetical protein WGH24286_01362 [Periweissella ghanensis]